jgi:hypothetical protein
MRDEEPMEANTEARNTVDLQRLLIVAGLAVGVLLIVGSLVYWLATRNRQPAVDPAVAQYRAALGEFTKEARVLMKLRGLNPSLKEYSDQVGRLQILMSRMPDPPADYGEWHKSALQLLASFRRSEDILAATVRSPLRLPPASMVDEMIQNELYQANTVGQIEAMLK